MYTSIALLIGVIKRVCETELGIVSQCCLPRNAFRGNNKQYLENVALKINVKVCRYISVILLCSSNLIYDYVLVCPKTGWRSKHSA